MRASGTTFLMLALMSIDFKVGDLVRIRIRPNGQPTEGIIISMKEEDLGWTPSIMIYYILLHGDGETVPCIAGELELINESG